MIASKTIIQIKKGAGTGTDCDIITSVNSGELLMIIGKTQPGGQIIPWYEINLNGQELYIRSDFVDIVSETKLDEEGSINSSTGWVHLRSLPGTGDECKIITTLNNGDWVEIFGELQPKGESIPWYRLRWQAGIGFVRSDFIDLTIDGVKLVSKAEAEIKRKESLLGGFFDTLGLSPSESYKYDVGGIFSFEYYYAQKEIDISGVTIQSAVNTLKNLNISDFKNLKNIKSGVAKLNPSSHVTLQILDGQMTGVQTQVNQYLTEQIYQKDTLKNILKGTDLLGPKILSDSTYQSIFNLNEMLGLNDDKLETEFIVGIDLQDADRLMFSLEVQDFIFKEANVVGAVNDILTIGIRLEKIEQLLDNGIEKAFDAIINELKELLKLFKKDAVVTCGIAAIAIIAMVAVIFTLPEDLIGAIVISILSGIEYIIDWIKSLGADDFYSRSLTTGLGAFKNLK